MTGHEATYKVSYFGMYVVTCPHGCNLGTSCWQDTEEGAAARVDLHRAATALLGALPRMEPVTVRVTCQICGGAVTGNRNGDPVHVTPPAVPGHAPAVYTAPHERN